MAKDKSDNPFADKAPYERILGVPADRIHEKVRRSADADGPLLTSRDLFGDIIEELGSSRGAAPAAPARPADEPGARTSPAAAGPDRGAKDDTRPPVATPPPATDDGYALLDLAYSTLLKDPRVHEELARVASRRAGGETVDYGAYLLLDRIATGGMAEVFRAKRKGVEGFEKIVAVKRILPHLSSNKDFVEMFIDEAKVVAGLSHPNIVPIFDLGKIEDTYYIAMEYVDGWDLRTVLGRAREKGLVLPVELAALIVRRVASALEYAHRFRDPAGRPLRIVHRDVSPQNILLSREGEVKLVDFGIAKAAIKATHTDSGALRGKLLYMSPEQAWGRALDRRSDLFSLGLVFFEMLTGRCLFSGSSEMSILERVREARIIPPSSLNPRVPIELEAVVTRTLKKDPDERYQDASEIIRDLDAYLRRRPAVGSAELGRFLAELFEGAAPP